MIWFTRLKKLIAHHFTELKWYTVVGLTAFYVCSSWLLLSLAGEHSLTDSIDFIYWIAVTGSTVGYGDLSPSSSAGKLIVALYIIPLGLSIFALLVGRVAAWVSHQWRKGILGMTNLHVQNHILVIGWNDKRTLLLLDLLLKEREADPEKPDIVLCVKADITNPLPNQIEFVHVSSFNSDEDMDKACVADARVILIDNPQDDVTMTTALYCSKRNPNAHKVAYFTDDSLVPLLQMHCPKVECTPSVAVEMLAKAAFDPGSSALHHDIISVDAGQAQYSADVPEAITNLSIEKLFTNLKTQYQATFIGFAPQGNYRELQINPDLTSYVSGNDKIFYIARKRISVIDWEAISQ